MTEELQREERNTGCVKRMFSVNAWQNNAEQTRLRGTATSISWNNHANWCKVFLQRMGVSFP